MSDKAMDDTEAFAKDLAIRALNTAWQAGVPAAVVTFSTFGSNAHAGYVTAIVGVGGAVLSALKTSALTAFGKGGAERQRGTDVLHEDLGLIVDRLDKALAGGESKLHLGKLDLGQITADVSAQVVAVETTGGGGGSTYPTVPSVGSASSITKPPVTGSSTEAQAIQTAANRPKPTPADPSLDVSPNETMGAPIPADDVYDQDADPANVEPAAPTESTDDDGTAEALPADDTSADEPVLTPPAVPDTSVVVYDSNGTALGYVDPAAIANGAA